MGEMRWIAVLAWLALSVASASARELYVNNGVGNDVNDGHRADARHGGGPVRTIARALALVERGDRIVLANTGQPYREMISISDTNHRGYADQPLVIDGSGATLDGTVVAAPGAWSYETDNIFSFRPRRLAYQQLFRDGRPLPHARAAKQAGGAVPLRPLEWTLLSNRLALRVEEGRLPEQYALRHAGLQTGITLYNTEHVRIENLVIQGFQQDGINAHELVSHCELVGVECRANGRSGISVGGVSRATILQSNCYDNGRAQLRVEGLARVQTQGCEFDHGNAAAPWIEMRGGSVTVDGVQYR